MTLDSLFLDAYKPSFSHFPLFCYVLPRETKNQCYSLTNFRKYFKDVSVLGNINGTVHFELCIFCLSILLNWFQDDVLSI